MKLDALEHPKLFHLMERLNVRRTSAIGHLELLWAFTAKHAAQGDIGKWPDGAIARACDWEDDAETFIHALVDAGFVDLDEEHRLVIHDWRDHAQGWVRAKLKKLQLDFIGTSDGTSERSSDDTSEGSADGTSEASSRARVPSLAKPSQAKSKNPLPPKGGELAHPRSEREIRKSGLDAWDRTCKVIDAIRKSPNGLTWADADKTLNDPLGAEAIKATGGHKAIADRTQFTQTDLKRRFREHYEAALGNRREAESPNGHDSTKQPQQASVSGLMSEAAKGMQ